MKTTGNLSLKKPDGTDVVDIADLNGNMDILDMEVVKKATTTADGRMSKEDKAKLDGIATGANNYVHPSTHSPSIIAQDASNRFVTDTEKSTWNGKASTEVVTTSANGLMSSVDKSKLDGVAVGANAYTHPATHPPSIIAQDAGNRFVSDTEKATWNAKQAALSGDVSGHYHSADRAWGNITGKPTTRAGYGITDAAPAGFGLGGAVTSIVGMDCNNIVNTGWYSGNGLINAPNTDWIMIEVIQHSSDWIYQRATYFVSTEGTRAPQFERHKRNGVWGAWEKIPYIYKSTSDPSGGNPGDIWIKHAP